MQTKKRAKPVKFGKAAKEAEQKATSAAAPVEEPKAEAPATAPEQPAAAKPAEPAQPSAPQNTELVDKLSDVPFETDFNSPSAAASSSPTAEEPAAPSTATPEDSFTATTTNPAEPAAPEEPKAEPVSSVSAPIDVSPSSGSVPPIGRSNEPIPYNPHETVFNTPPDAGEKKKNPFLYFLIIAFVAFVTGIAFMAGLYYAMPDKTFFATPSIPSLPGTAEPTPTAAPVAAATATPAPSVTIADYKIRVLNGSGVSGQAAKVKASLTAEGLTVTSTGNAETSDVQKTQITYKKTVSAAALTKVKDILKKTYVLEKETELPSAAASEPDITITIGKQTAQ